MITVISPTRAATLFWRLAVLRRQLDRAGGEIELLGHLTLDGDLAGSLREAREFIEQAITHLTPEPEHSDNCVTKEQ